MTWQYPGTRAIRRYPLRKSGVAPAAGADWSITVPGGQLWELISVYAQITTAVAVANRLPNLQISDGDITWLTLPGDAATAASLTGTYVWANGISPLSAAHGITAGLPRDLYLMPGSVVSVSTDNVQAADQWGVPVLNLIVTEFAGGRIDLADPPMAVVIVNSTAE